MVSDTLALAYRVRSSPKGDNVLYLLMFLDAVYAALVAPSRPKNESVTNQRTDGRTDRPTDGHTLIKSRFVATKKG